MSWSIGNGRFGTRRERNRDDNVVKGERRVFEFVLEVDGKVSRIGRRPTVDYRECIDESAYMS